MVLYSNGGLKTGLKKACLWSKMFGIWMVCQVGWLYHTVRYSDESGIQMSGIQMVTVSFFEIYFWTKNILTKRLTRFLVHPSAGNWWTESSGLQCASRRLRSTCQRRARAPSCPRCPCRSIEESSWERRANCSGSNQPGKQNWCSTIILQKTQPWWLGGRALAS